MSRLAWSVLLAGSVAHAGPFDPAGGSPRAIGRAGTSAVADDGGGALTINPAAIARRSAWRLQLGIGFVDDATAWTSDADGAPVSRDQGGSSVLPLVAVMGAFGDWLVGASAATTGATDRALRDPFDVSDVTVYEHRFDYRYAGIAGELRRDALTVAVARRFGDALALGLATGISRITARETRRMWVGFESTTQQGVGDPTRDVQLALEGDTYVPHATLGALLAPVDTPLELGLSIGWVKRPTVHGTVTGAGIPGFTTVRTSSPSADLILRQPIAIHAGARYVGDRIALELGGDLWLASREAAKVAWELTGVRVRDKSMVETELDGVPSRYSLRSHGAIRLSGDVEVLSGFLWATAGYAYSVGGTTESRLSPTLGDLGGHTIALGIEGTAGGVTYTIGWSRTLSRVTRRETDLRLDNPFAAGDAYVPDGSFDGSTDQVGVLLDLELAAP